MRSRHGRAPGVPSRAAVMVALSTATALACAAPESGADTMRADAAPDSFLVAFETSRGDFVMELHREWSPMGVDRVHRLALDNFYAGARIYRVNPRYAQFGYTGRPRLDSIWVGDALPDEPVRASNVRGTVSFARGGPGTRSVILFVNRSDNTDLDRLEWRGVLGFPPVGRIRSGMEVVDALYADYGDDPLEWEDSVAALGNAFLDRRYPGLDSIIGVRIVEDWR